jgi:hypothetical protein
MTEIHEYDVVALIDEAPSLHKETKQPILLKRGQVGTVMMSFNDHAYLIDFSDSQGKTYAMETIPARQLMCLVYEPTLLCNA